MSPLVFALVSITLLCKSIAVVQQCDVETETLCVNQVNDPGFGDLSNQYAFSMAEFNGALYVGTLNSVKGGQDLLMFFLGFPFDSNGAEIWKGTLSGTTWSWTRVLDGGNLDNPDSDGINNFGVRKLLAVDDYLYAVTANHVNGFEVWRTTGDGTNWEVVPGTAGGFGNTENTSGRGMGVFNGYLYIGGENRKTGASVWRRQLDAIGDFAADSDWEHVIMDGGDDPKNWWFSDFAVYNGYIYTGALNSGGMGLYRSVTGAAGDWQTVFTRGYGHEGDTAAMTLYVYDGKLYIGTMDFVKGTKLYVNTDADVKEFDAVFINGNGDTSNVYVWQMREYQGVLYMSTFKRGDGGFDLYSSTDPLGNGLTVETATGFDTGHYGIRSMIVFEDRLMMGTATADHEFACRVFEGMPLETIPV